MPGMNQLGGAQTVTQTAATPQNAETQPSPSPQADAGLQVVPEDAVQGIENAKRGDGQTADEQSSEAQRERRSFSQLSNGRRRRVDGPTGAVIELSAESDIREAKMREEADLRAEVEAQNRQAAESNRQRLERALAGDLFARPMKVEASAQETQDESKSVTATQAEDDN